MNADKLKGEIVGRGMNIGSFCDKCGFVRCTFDRKLNGQSEFTRSEIESIAKALGLNLEQIRNIFFTNIVA